MLLRSYGLGGLSQPIHQANELIFGFLTQIWCPKALWQLDHCVRRSLRPQRSSLELKETLEIINDTDATLFVETAKI